MKRSVFDETPISELVEEYARRLSSSSGSPSFIFYWKYIIGENLYDYVKVKEIKGNKLFVKTTHPACRLEVRRYEKSILARLHEKDPESTIDTIIAY